ncbi:MAG TPA: F0F1 ATP synthase subunit A [Chitinophagales bacterium]|nr:F0F1 ATP synthase subunit A [Chitinophagales bacterium]
MKLLKQMPLKPLFGALFLAFFMHFGAFAENAAEANSTVKEEKKAEKFDAGTLIMEHISDSHEWHILGEGEHTIAIPLPVILYTDKGLDVFMSGKFEHGEAVAQGKYYNYKLNETNHVIVVGDDGKENKEATDKLYDISITKNVASLFFSAFLLLVIFLSIAKSYTTNRGKAPKGLQSALEPFIIFIRDEVAKQSIGKKYERFMPYLLTVFFFIWINNMLGIIPILPGGANLTGNIAVTGFLALLTFIITTVNGNKHYWGHILAMPGVPKFVLVILTPIEIMGVFLRPFVLMIRLFANIMAGHIIALSFFCLIFIFGEMHVGMGYGVGILSVLFNVFMGLMEVLVALIQAYVFTLLSAIYFGAAVEESHNHKESLV